MPASSESVIKSACTELIYRFALLVTSSLIFAVGLVMVFSATSAEVLDHDLSHSTHHALFKQISYACVGIIGAFCVFRLGYEKLLRYSPLLLLACTVLLLLTLIPGVGKVVNGSRRWLSLGGLSFQPSEFLKVIIPLFMIQKVCCTREEFRWQQFLKLVAQVSVSVVFIMLQPNNGTAAVIVMTMIVLFILMKIPMRYWVLPLFCSVLIGVAFAARLPYVSARLKVYLHPELDITGRGHQPFQAKIAAGSGKFWGKGPGNSLQKLSYLPEAQNDYILAIFAEEFGFFGVLWIILLYMSFTYTGFAVAYRSTYRKGCYLAAAVTFLISFQAFLNMAVVSGLLPSTGLNLPLFSRGGTSLVANMMGISLLWSISTTQRR